MKKKLTAIIALGLAVSCMAAPMASASNNSMNDVNYKGNADRGTGYWVIDPNVTGNGGSLTYNFVPNQIIPSQIKGKPEGTRFGYFTDDYTGGNNSMNSVDDGAVIRSGDYIIIG